MIPSKPLPNYHISPEQTKNQTNDREKLLNILEERGSLTQIPAEIRSQMGVELLSWLLWAENHKGSEIVYQNPEGKIRGIPLNSYFNFPEKYAAQMPQGAFISAELDNGYSTIVYLQEVTQDKFIEALEKTKEEWPLTIGRPLNEKLLERLMDQGHLGYLDKEGRDKLNLKILKYLDYAVNIRPGSEIVYLDDQGVVRGDSIEKVLGLPQKYAQVPKPVYLTIEVEEQSVIFSTSDCSPENIVRLIQKAYTTLQN